MTRKKNHIDNTWNTTLWDGRLLLDDKTSTEKLCTADMTTDVFMARLRDGGKRGLKAVPTMSVSSGATTVNRLRPNWSRCSRSDAIIIRLLIVTAGKPTPRNGRCRRDNSAKNVYDNSFRPTGICVLRAESLASFWLGRSARFTAGCLIELFEGPSRRPFSRSCM